MHFKIGTVITQLFRAYLVDCIAGRVIFCLLMMLILWLVSNFVSFPISNEIIQTVLLCFLGTEIHYSTLKQITPTAITTLCVIITLGLPFYYFVYRELKSTSESAINKNRSFYFTIFIVVSIYVVLNLWYLNFAIENGILVSYSKVAYTFTLFAIVILMGGFIVISLFTYINIRTLLASLIQDVKSNVYSLNYMGTATILRPTRAAIYDRLFYLIESVYQMLMQAIEKDMNIVYDTNYDTWSTVLSMVHGNQRLVDDIPSERRYMFLLKTDPDRYRNLYKSILKNHLSLISVLLDNNKINEAHSSIEKMFELIPEHNLCDLKGAEKQFVDDYSALQIEYFITLYELSMVLYKKDQVGLQPVIRTLRNLSAGIADTLDVITVYRSLIIKAVENSDVKLITTLAYSIAESVKVSDKSPDTDVNQSENIGNKMAHILKIISSQKKLLLSNSDEDKNIGICLYILMQAALKGIELSHYTIVGFLVKYLVSNFPGDLLALSFSKLYLNGGTKDWVIERRILADKIKVSFNFNETTAKYCLEKLAFLLYAQQIYISSCSVLIKHIPTSFIDISVIRTSNIKYIAQKISKAGSKYGLLYIEEEAFLTDVEECCRARYRGE